MTCRTPTIAASHRLVAKHAPVVLVWSSLVVAWEKAAREHTWYSPRVQTSTAATQAGVVALRGPGVFSALRSVAKHALESCVRSAVEMRTCDGAMVSFADVADALSSDGAPKKLFSAVVGYGAVPFGTKRLLREPADSYAYRRTHPDDDFFRAFSRRPPTI